jgi:hypothetical protein
MITWAHPQGIRREGDWRRRSRMLGLTLAMAAIVAATAPGMAQSPPSSSQPSTSPAQASAEPGAVGQDLQFYQGTALTRLDGLSGAVLERQDVSAPECQIPVDLPVFSAPGHRDILLRKGALKYADYDPDYVVVGSCILRIPLDGSPARSYAIPRAHRAMVLNDIAVVGDTIWVVAWDRRSPQDTLDYYADLTLFRLDEWAGDLDPVMERVVAVAPSAVGPVVLFTREGSPRDVHVAVLEDPMGEPRLLDSLEDALPRLPRSALPEPRLRLATGTDGTVAVYDRYGTRDILVFDPTADLLVASVSPVERMASLGSVVPTSGGVWMSGQRGDGQDVAAYSTYGGATMAIDPCEGIPGACFGTLEAATEDAAWISAWPYDRDSYEVDMMAARMRRYQNGVPVPTLDVSGRELFEP